MRFFIDTAKVEDIKKANDMGVISLMTSLKSLPSFAIRDGFVVTPQITPISLAFRISSTLAVSIKNFIGIPLLFGYFFEPVSIVMATGRNVNGQSAPSSACVPQALETIIFIHAADPEPVLVPVLLDPQLTVSSVRKLCLCPGRPRFIRELCGP